MRLRFILPATFAIAAMVSCFGGAKVPVTGDPQEVGVAWVDLLFQLQPRGRPPGYDPVNGRTLGAVLVRKSDLKEFSGTIYDERFVIFTNLAPGTYALVAVMGTRDYERGEVLDMYDCGDEKGPCPMAIEVDVVLEPKERHTLTVDVDPGKIHYLGTVVYDLLRQPPYDDIRKGLAGKYYVDYFEHDSDRGRPQVVNEPESEHRALYLLTEKLGNGPWESQFRGRRKQLWEELQGDRPSFSL